VNTDGATRGCFDLSSRICGDFFRFFRDTKFYLCWV